jgi:molybdenum cofactor biosynthesis protein B
MTDIRSHEAHRRHAEQIPSVRCAVLTISDTRTEATDTSGHLLRALLEADATLRESELLPDFGGA